MKISLGQNQWFDGEGKPLAAGRISVYVHGSNIPKDIFTLDSGEVFTQAANPYVLDDAGRAPTLWFDAATVDVKVEAIGFAGSYSLVDTYQDGFDMTDGRNDTLVYGIAGLKEADTGLGTVTVAGFNTSTDCAPRAFVWDPTCTAASDGCAIVESDVDQDGRWILLSDSRYMPSSFYGIVPGTDEANTGAFLTYQDRVGQWNIQLPPVPRFMAGTYVSEGTFSTVKTLSFDTGAQFSVADFVCRSVEIFPNTDFVADFSFNYRETVAHSSWFRSVYSFLTCGANTLVVDSTDNFVDRTLKYKATLSQATLVYPANTRLAINYVNIGKLALSRVNLVGSGMFDATDRIEFSYMAIRDEWWQSPNSVDWVNNVAARSSSNNVLLLSNFKYVHAYIEAVKANGETSLDLSGRYVSSFTDTSFTELRNISCGRLEIDMSGQDVTLHNVKAANCEVLCHFLVCDDNCDLHFTEAEPVVNAAWFTDSSIHGSTTWAQNTTYEFKRCAVSVTFRRVSNNEDNENGLFFEDCQLQENCVVESKALVMKHCTTLNNTIRIYPYYDSDNSFYRMSVTLEGNLFTNATPIEFTRVETDAYGNVNEGCMDIRVDWYIVGNTFAGNSEGLRCRYWQRYDGADPSGVFIKRGDYTNSSITYRGNLGLCPANNGHGMHCTDASGSDWNVIEVGGVHYSYFVANWGRRRVMPNIREAGAGASLNYLGSTSIDNDEYAIKTFDNPDFKIYRANVFMYPSSTLVHTDNGDLFSMAMCMIDNITPAAPDDGHQWRYLT